MTCQRPMFHCCLLSVTLAPQNAALSARNVGADTADRTVSSHHPNIQIANLIQSSNLKKIASDTLQYLCTTRGGAATAVVAVVGRGIYFGFYKTDVPEKLAYGVESENGWDGIDCRVIEHTFC